MNYATGKFRAQALEGSLGYSSTGKEELAVQFLILEGPDEGKKITWWGYLSEAAADRTLQSLLYSGWDGQDVSVLKGLGSKNVILDIQEDTYNGVTKTKVAWVNSLSAKPTHSPDRAMSESQKSSFAAKMRGRTLALQQNIPAQVGQVADTAPVDNAEAVSGDDDIPF